MTNQSYPCNNDLSCEKVTELFEYKDGELFWKKPGPNKRTDRPAGAVNRDGYRIEEVRRETEALKKANAALKRLYANNNEGMKRLADS